MLELIQIKKSFNNHEVLNIPSLQIEPGITWIKGMNGSGKSTLLKIMAGLVPFQGDVIMNNTLSIKKNAVAYRRQINFAPAEPTYPPFISGQDLVEYYCQIKGKSSVTIESVKNILSINGYIHNPTGSYSSGMLKKLSLLLAFIGQPTCILLDEPFTTIDTETQSSLQQYISERNDLSFIFTSHHTIHIEKMPISHIFTMKDKLLLNE